MSITSDRTYTTIDKTTWGEGPWQHEPDKMQWVDEATDLDCLIVRSRLGALCGYVGVGPGHPWHRKACGAKVIDTDTEWGGTIEFLMEVHGGLTYANACQEDADEAEGICHIPLPGRSPDMWWFGFDCAHAGDLSPWTDARCRERGDEPVRFDDEHYRTIGYVQRECAHLAQQLAEVCASQA